MDSIHSPFPASSEKERVLLRDIANRDPKERENAIQNYKKWIEEEILNNNNCNISYIEDSVLHALKVSFGGQTEHEIIGFVELVNAVLDFPIIVEDRLVFITSLLEEIIRDCDSNNVIIPVIGVTPFFPVRYRLANTFLNHIISW